MQILFETVSACGISGNLQILCETVSACEISGAVQILCETVSACELSGNLRIIRETVSASETYPDGEYWSHAGVHRGSAGTPCPVPGEKLLADNTVDEGDRES